MKNTCYMCVHVYGISFSGWCNKQAIFPAHSHAFHRTKAQASSQPKGDPTPRPFAPATGPNWWGYWCASPEVRVVSMRTDPVPWHLLNMLPLLCRPSLKSSTLEGIPEEQEVLQDDVFSPPQRSTPMGSLFSHPESSLPLIGKVSLFFSKRDSLGGFQGYSS